MTFKVDKIVPYSPTKLPALKPPSFLETVVPIFLSVRCDKCGAYLCISDKTKLHTQGNIFVTTDHHCKESQHVYQS